MDIFSRSVCQIGLLIRDLVTMDIAPTLANYLGIKQPSASIGEPLAEVLGN